MPSASQGSNRKLLASKFPAIHRAWRRPTFVVGLAALASLILVAVFARLLAPHDPLAINVPSALQPPSPGFLFGTDRYGRDVLSRLILGARTSLAIALGSIAVSLFFGTTFGLVAGYAGGALDNVIMRVMDILFTLPQLVLALMIVTILGPGAVNAGIAIIVLYSPVFSRIARGATLAMIGKEYLIAARALGAGWNRIIFHHVLPNALTPLIVQASLNVSSAVLIESSLSYLGLGTQPPSSSWGTMMSEGRAFLESAPWLSIFPGLVIMASVLAFNLVGDGLRDILDPRSR